MARFCDKCGTQLRDTSAYCIGCGAPTPVALTPVEGAAAGVPYQPVQQPASGSPAAGQAPPTQGAQAGYGAAQPGYGPVQTGYGAAQPGYGAPASQPQPGYGPPPASATNQKSGSGLKILLIVLAVLGFGAMVVVGGVLYVGHRVVSKIKDSAAEAGLSTSDLSRTGHAFHGDACRFLSKGEVGEAIGVTITETKSSENSCEYQARGTPSEMTSKHLSAMLGKRGADAATQEKMQKLMGGMMSQQVDPKDRAGDVVEGAAVGDTTVLAVSIDENAARTQMKLNSKILGGMGPEMGSSTLTGIGDEAFVAADGMMMVRKGDTLIRIMYTSCPCGTEQIKPLARKVADAL